MTGQEAIIFAGEAHKKFYEEQLLKCRSQDCWHKALIYALGITENIRSHFKYAYSMESDRINRDSLSQGWVTGTDARVMRLAFTLFTDCVPADEDEARKYQINNIFGSVNTRFLCQAIKLRYDN